MNQIKFELRKGWNFGAPTGFMERFLSGFDSSNRCFLVLRWLTSLKNNFQREYFKSDSTILVMNSKSRNYKQNQSYNPYTINLEVIVTFWLEFLISSVLQIFWHVHEMVGTKERLNILVSSWLFHSDQGTWTKGNICIRYTL